MRVSNPSRRTLLKGLFGAATLAIAGCGDAESNEPRPTTPGGRSTPPGANSTETPSTQPPAATAPPAPDVSLELRVAEMIMMGFTGTSMADIDPIADALRQGRVGNLVHFDRNIVSPAQIATLNRDLTEISPSLPLIAVDQEGGFVARMRPDKGFPETVTALYLGNRDVGLTTESATSIATTLREAGFNLNLAPVLDVNVDPSSPAIGFYERSFSADPEVVAEHGLAFIRAHHQQGILCTLKHFAGHGSAAADSHLGFVDVSTTWSEDELIPFRRVIEAGEADAVMTAHIFNSQLDDTYPGTLSRNTITGLLREDLGFEGVVITDDMQMGAIRQYFGYEEAIRLAILAGADMIAVANVLAFDPQLPFKTYDAIMLAVESGAISEERIDESYQRIRRLKARLA